MGAELTILGATGYTGRLCAEEAVRQGVPVRLAGRRRDALEDLAGELGVDDIEVADVHDRRALAKLAGETRVLITTVGPYAKLGRPVLEAAIAGGAHYLDVSGEVSFLQWAHAQGDRAAEAGVALCPGFGFDGVPGELLAAIVADELGGLVSEVRAAYLVRRGRVSAGTARSALDAAAHGGAAWVGGRVVDEAPGAHRWRVPYPEPLGARGAISVPFPEVVTIGRSTGAHTVRAYFDAPGAAPVVPLIARPANLALRALARTPVWPVLHRGVDQLPDGPAEASRSATRTAVLVEARGPEGVARAWVRIWDLYLATARIAVGVARRFVDAGAPAAGALTPSQALGGAAGAGELLREIGGDWSLLT
jgi:short subunit dehydrogenase-like uncharacterized protein